MITFTKLGQFGRFGNALWQYAAIKGISLKTGYELKIPNPNLVEYQQQKCLLRYFDLPDPYLDGTEQILYTYNMYEAQFFNPNLIGIMEDHTDFCGYFQNTQYFFGFEKEIRQALTLQPTIKQKIRKNFQQIIKQYSRPIISIHVKRGELVNETTVNNINFYGSNGILLTYLRQAIAYFKRIFYKPTFLIFTNRIDDFNKYGSKDDPQHWCNTYLCDDDIMLQTNETDIEDFAMMSMCDHNILCHSTTFGWWAAWLNTNKNKIVIAPKYYFMDRTKFVDGFYPKEWVLL